MVLGDSSIKDAIRNYSFHLEDPLYLAAILSATDTTGLMQELIELLTSDNHTDVSDAGLFIRDLVLVAHRFKLGALFRKMLPGSALIRQLEIMVSSPSYDIRCLSILTLSEIGSRSSLPILHRAFHRSLWNDPLTLARLLGEIWWLERRPSRELVDAILVSPEYTIRWSVLEPLSVWHSSDGKLINVKQRCYEQLRHDSNVLVRSEAEYLYRLLLLDHQKLRLTRLEMRRERKLVDQQQPALSFMDIEIGFGHQLSQSKQLDYTLAELHQFIDAKVAV